MVEFLNFINWILSDEKILFWIISVALTIIGYYIYIKDIYYWQNKPHFYSWFVWWIITSILYIIQIQHWWWAGAWVALISWIMSFVIAIIAFTKWTKDITKSDTISLILAFISIWLWIGRENVLYSVLLLVAIDIFWYYPTFRKSIVNPYEENYMLYLISIFKFWIAIFALNTITIETSLYLAANVIILFFLAWTIIFLRNLIIKD